MGITEDIFGTFCDPDGGKKEVKRYTLTCKSGVEVQVNTRSVKSWISSI